MNRVERTRTPGRRLTSLLRGTRGSAVVQYAMIAGGISIAVIGGANRGGQQARQQLETVAEAFQKYTPLQRLIP